MSKSWMQRHPVDELPVNVTAKCLARLIGVQPARINGLVSENKISIVAHNSYNLIDCVNSYASFLRNRKSSGDEKKDLEQEKLKKAQRENREAEKELIKMSEAAQLFMFLASTFLNLLDGLPPRVSDELALETNPAIIEDTLSNECNQLRTTLSRTVQDSKFKEYFPQDPNPEGKKINFGVGKSRKNPATRESRTRRLQISSNTLFYPGDELF